MTALPRGQGQTLRSDHHSACEDPPWVRCTGAIGQGTAPGFQPSLGWSTLTGPQATVPASLRPPFQGPKLETPLDPLPQDPGVLMGR